MEPEKTKKGVICISVYKSKQKPSNVRFIGHSQELLIDVKNWVKAQNPSNVDVDLIRFLELAVGIMSHSVIGNNGINGFLII